MATLSDIIDSTKLDPAFCASLIGVAPSQFHEWMSGQPIPAFALPELSNVLGVPEAQLQGHGSTPVSEHHKIAPPVWYKLRNEKLTSSDREMVGMLRKLGFFLSQLHEVRGETTLEYVPVFTFIRDSVDRTAPPSVQGAQAAAFFRDMSGLGKGHTGIGELIRGYFRRVGLLLVESPLKQSSLEGCCFRVGTLLTCIFANSFDSTWFRRNAILMHELCHAIFDVDDDPVTLDFALDETEEHIPLNEARAQAFAQDVLVPRAVLNHYTNQFGIKWSNLSVRDLARLVAHIHVEKFLILTAAKDAGLIDAALLQEYRSFNCDPILRELSDHALTTREYLRSRVGESPKWIASNRNTEIGTRSLRLPVRYVDEVIRALNAGDISLGKAAEMTMMEKRTFLARFGDLVTVG